MTSFYVLSIEPFTVSIKKNKRAVSVAVAKRLVAKQYPEASAEGWIIGMGSHRTVARRNDSWVPKSSLLED